MFYVLVMAVGTVGNLLVLVTVFKVFKSPNVTNMFITSLAFADLFIVLICIPFRVSKMPSKLDFLKVAGVVHDCQDNTTV